MQQLFRIISAPVSNPSPIPLLVIPHLTLLVALIQTHWSTKLDFGAVITFNLMVLLFGVSRHVYVATPEENTLTQHAMRSISTALS